MLLEWDAQSSVKVQQPPISRNALPPLDGFHGDLYVSEFCQLNRTGRVRLSVSVLSWARMLCFRTCYSQLDVRFATPLCLSLRRFGLGVVSMGPNRYTLILDVSVPPGDTLTLYSLCYLSCPFGCQASRGEMILHFEHTKGRVV